MECHAQAGLYPFSLFEMSGAQLRRGGSVSSETARMAGESVVKALDEIHFSRFCTIALDSSRSASLPIQRGAESCDSASFFASAIDAVLSLRLRRPMPRSAQLTAFFTKLRSSLAAFATSGRQRR